MISEVGLYGSESFGLKNYRSHRYKMVCEDPGKFCIKLVNDNSAKTTKYERE